MRLGKNLYTSLEGLGMRLGAVTEILVPKHRPEYSLNRMLNVVNEESQEAWHCGSGGVRGAAHAHSASTWQSVIIGTSAAAIASSEFGVLKSADSLTPPLCLLYSAVAMSTEADPFSPEQLAVLGEMLGTEIGAALARDRRSAPTEGPGPSGELRGAHISAGSGAGTPGVGVFSGP